MTRTMPDDLDALAAAAGEPPRPKSRATPAKTAGGKSSMDSAKADAVSDWQAMCAFRAVLARNSALTRVELVREAACELGFARTGARISQNLDGAIRRAVRRAIAVSTRGTLSLGTRSIADYDRVFLKRHLLSVIGGAWCDKADIPVRFARTLGFARTGAKIEDTVWAMMKVLQRAGLVEVEGRGATACYRKARAS